MHAPGGGFMARPGMMQHPALAHRPMGPSMGPGHPMGPPHHGFPHRGFRGGFGGGFWPYGYPYGYGALCPPGYGNQFCPPCPVPNYGVCPTPYAAFSPYY